MKNNRSIYNLLLLVALMYFLLSCKKENTTIIPLVDGTVTDIDNNVYKTVTIGTQTWMAENLKVTKYKDGTSIPLVTDNTAWKSLTTPAYCWYNNDATNKTVYGGLYNWYTVTTGKVCPTGWHVPSDTEWATLINFLGGETLAGGKIKEKGLSRWLSPNTGATNETGFTAIPGGFHDGNGRFAEVGNFGAWWSSASLSTSTAWFYTAYSGDSNANKDDDYMRSGFSVRCVKD